ncbi:MAG: class I SAM-dependent methyltransferase [Bacillota bacterium]
MADWSKSFSDKKYIALIPQPEAYYFIKAMENLFGTNPLDIWDLCCGAGRHTVLISKMGHRAYGSDFSENAVEHARKWLEDEGLNAELAVAGMTEQPWGSIRFHAVIAWDALHHDTLDRIKKTVGIVYDSLTNGGAFMVSLLSTKDRAYKKGLEIEENTFIWEDGAEAGVPRHYFDESAIRSLFAKWELISLVEYAATYVQREPDYFKPNPFPDTKWGVIAKKRGVRITH